MLHYSFRKPWSFNVCWCYTFNWIEFGRRKENLQAVLTFCSWWEGYFNKIGFEHWKSIKNVSRMRILHCREVPLISIESGRGIIILSMILLYCNFIHHGLLKVASDLLWICAGKRFPCKDQMNVTEDLTSAEWKHFVGKNEIVRESRSSFKK